MHVRDTLHRPLTTAGPAEQRALRPFDALRLTGRFTLYVLQGDAPTLTVEASATVAACVLTEQSDGVLTVRHNSLPEGATPPRLYLTAPDLRRCVLEGTGSLVSLQQLRLKELDVHIHGAGNVKLYVTANRLSAILQGAGGLWLKGAAERLELDVRSSADVHAFNLTAEEVLVRCGGSGAIEVQARRRLEVDNHGSSDVRYRDYPHIVETRKGVGRVVNGN